MRTKTKVCKIFILKNGLKIERTDNGRRCTLHAHGDRNTWRKDSRGGTGLFSEGRGSFGVDSAY